MYIPLLYLSLHIWLSHISLHGCLIYLSVFLFLNISLSMSVLLVCLCQSLSLQLVPFVLGCISISKRVFESIVCCFWLFWGWPTPLEWVASGFTKTIELSIYIHANEQPGMADSETKTQPYRQTYTHIYVNLQSPRELTGSTSKSQV